MNINIKLIIIVVLTAFSTQVKAQDPIFSQFLLVPEVFNPGFTGSANTWNAGIVHRRQWHDGNRRMNTQYGFANNLVSDNIGLGITVLNHNEEFTNYNYFQFNGVVSYKIDLNDDYTLRFGLEGGYGRKDFNFGNLLLEDQININTGAISVGSIDPGALNFENKVNFIDFSAGIVVDQENGWFGASLKHLNRPNISFTDNGNVPLEMFLSVHGGYYLGLNNSPSMIFPEDSDVLFTFNYMRQSQYNRLDIGVALDMKIISFGIIAATNPERKSPNSHLLSSLNPFVSTKFGEFTFGYSYDFNTSQLGNMQGVHELSLTWQSSYMCGRCDNYKVKLKRNGKSGYQRN